jgi:single-stranded DNA-binding protein
MPTQPTKQTCAQHLVKGRQVAVTGRLTYQQWETRDGQKRSKHSVIGRVQFGQDPRSDGDHAAEDREGASDE